MIRGHRSQAVSRHACGVAPHARAIYHGSSTSRASLPRRVPARAVVKFNVQQEVGWGDKLVVVGNHKRLGRWDLGKAMELAWSDGNVWTGEAELPSEQSLEFKLVNVKGQGEPEWEDGQNRTLTLNGSDLVVDMEWSDTDNGSVRATDTAPGSRGESANSGKAETARSSDEEGSGTSSDSGDDALDRLPQSAWQGREVQFMKENRHSKERSGVWHKDGLEGPMLQLVEGDEKSGSWLQKLGVAKALVVDASPDMRPSLDALAPLYIYLQWISTGAIPCVEGGGHYRPNRHAELSKIMFRSLEWVAGDGGRSETDRALARRLQAKLPSFGEEFTASVPLTRIRDIAHRNDIPHDLKREIKHTLQNKLHRNAGPEDLVATELMLERITAPGADFSEAFVAEFQVFTDELRDFFNAASLAKSLKGIEGALDDAGVSSVERFLSSKAALDGAGQGASVNDIVECMHHLTTVRALVVAGLSSGLRNDAPDSAMVMRQKWRLAELRCEDYAFVLASRFLNALEGAGGAGYLAGAHEREWAHPLGMLLLCVRHCGLSGWKAGECHAIDQEVAAWQRLGIAQSKDDMLRLRATLDRCKRLTDGYADAQLSVFAARAKQLGGALGIPEQVQQVFTEAEIRANVVFQLSKLNTLLLKAARAVLGSADFDAVVLGAARGVLLHVPRIEPGAAMADGADCILLVDEASGDEEVTTAGENIKGVILCQDLPHLSHLGVRARQEKVPFVTCTAADIIEGTLTPLLGSQVDLSVTAAAISVAEAGSTQHGSAARSPTPLDRVADAVGASAPERAPAQLCKRPEVVPLPDARSETCGAKAASCSALLKVADAAASSETPFRAVPGAVLPFGCMEAAVKGAGKARDLGAVLDKMDGVGAGPELDALCAEAQDLVRACPPDAKLVAALQRAMGDASDVVIARSSANVEDLAGLSAAGLYESVPNLRVRDESQLAAGVAAVWASLYSRRAVLSRRAARIPQKDATMAVLVQEMKAPETSFVLHTADPMAEEPSSSVYAEAAPGLGETLAAGIEGSAWRASIAKGTGAVTMHSMANFSLAYMPAGTARAPVDPTASIYDAQGRQEGEAHGTVRRTVVDYSTQRLSQDHEARSALFVKLAGMGQLLEEHFGSPQDVEGSLIGDDVYIVQSRPQP